MCNGFQITLKTSKMAYYFLVIFVFSGFSQYIMLLFLVKVGPKERVGHLTSASNPALSEKEQKKLGMFFYQH